MRLLRVWGDGDDGYFVFLRPVAPEHAESGRRAVLNVCLEDLFAFLIWIFERLILVGLKARMFWVGEQMLNGLMYLFEKPFYLAFFTLSFRFTVGL